MVVGLDGLRCQMLQRSSNGSQYWIAAHTRPRLCAVRIHDWLVDAGCVSRPLER